MSEVIQFKRSPFFYVGDKYKIIGKIKKYFPSKIDTLVEPFLGGGSVFINVEANHYILNDIDKNVISMHKYFAKQAKQEKTFLQNIKTLADQYGLSQSVFKNVIPTSLKEKWIKTYYAEYNREGYNKLKTSYNKAEKKNYLELYLLLIYGFNRILRFNKSGEFNVPVGNVDLNKNVLQALHDYFAVIKNKDIKFFNFDFKNFIQGLTLNKNDFVYVDPPYLISASEYNKLWGDNQEVELLNILDDLNNQGIKFALSNITTYNGKRNEKLLVWMRKYKVHEIDSNYISYHNNTKKKITEVLITNY